MIRTKSVKDTVEESDGKRILVMRRWPRPYSKVGLQVAGDGQWLRDLAPSFELLDDWNKERITWDEYVARYKEEMMYQKEAIAALAEEASHGTVTLLCKEDESDPHCHRHLLKKIVEDILRA